ncbi:MAG: hypothetical protein COU33_04280, partial [Candidatus Magasanikbacteria bacterium CG10_big_fil_rev_8_21_14_0_10_43_6]
MTNTSKIPCTVAILTRNSANTLRKTLGSLERFEEMIICDGGSTDDTLAIAQEHGARIIIQDRQFLDADGRINDFSRVRNQTLEAASYDWYFYIDADEEATSNLVEEIAKIVDGGSPAAYWIPRQYVFQGKHIKCATTYPNKQMRLFNKKVTNEFIKAVHERIEVISSTSIYETKGVILVPIDSDIESLRY